MGKEQFKTIFIEKEDLSSEITNLKKSKESKLEQSILEFETREKRQASKFNGAIIGKLIGLDDSGKPLVDFPSNQAGYSLPACSTVSLSKEKIGREIALIFEEGDPKKPIIVGFIQHPEEAASPINVEIDGERLNLTAQKEIVLHCGKASITLTRAGKIIIRGTYLLNRSSGVNRIKGGSVQIN